MPALADSTGRIAVPDAVDASRCLPIRQWLCFPPSTPNRNKGPAQAYRVVLETRLGRLAWFEILQRQAPGLGVLETVASRLDSYRHAPKPERLSGDLCTKDDIEIALIDQDVSDEMHWNLAIFEKRAVLEAVMDGRIAKVQSGVREAILESVRHDFRSGLSAFMAALDVEVVDALRRGGAFRPELYNHVADCGPELRRNRLQALTLFPVLQHCLLNLGWREVRDAIDEGRPLIDELARRFDVPPSVIRAVRGTAPLAAGKPVDRLDIVFPLLRDIPAAWWPKSPEDWVAFAEAARHVSHITHHPVTTTANRLVMRDCARRAYRLPDLDNDGWNRMGREIDDFQRGLRDGLRYSLRGRDDRSDLDLFVTHVSNRMLASLGIERVGQIARRWGEAYRRVQADFALESEIWRGVRWPSLGESPIDLGDLTAHLLCTARELSDEGRAMNNCVAAYVPECLRGSGQIWSFRTPAGDRAATLETHLVRATDGSLRVHIGQLAGPGNSRPTDHVRKAARDLLRRIDTDRSALETYQRWRQTVLSKPMTERIATAFSQPILWALEEVLPPVWSLDAIIALRQA